MPNIYQLTNEFLSLYDELIESADRETGELDVEVTERFNAVQMKFEEKAIATATVYRMLEEESARVDEAIKRLTAYKNRLDGNKERVKTTLTNACVATGTTQLRGLYANISFRKSVQTVIDNLDALPEEYVKKKIEYVADKAAIKKAIEAGAEISGAHLEKIENIQIK